MAGRQSFLVLKLTEKKFINKNNHKLLTYAYQKTKLYQKYK